ncbi:MAG: pyridoxal-phosphate dependent enzyme [Candidatus Thermoplasmatota archaeon]|nr:pyridoxal-phosphate dependent enzyme [Candidatus Thermoplasmatota archaeon]
MIPLELIREFERQMKSLRIGATPLVRAQKLEKVLGVRRLQLKLEGENPSGTHKDRSALLHCLDARNAGKKAVTAVSCGNYGAALTYVAEKLDMRSHIYIPKDFAAPRRAEIESMGGIVVDVEGDYEAALRKSLLDAVTKGWYNANPGGANKELGVYAYTFIAKEIAQEMGRQPDWVAVPVGNGTLIGGIWRGFRSIGMKTRMLGVSNNNSAVHGLVMGQREPLDVPDLQITEINEPLAGNYLAEPEEAISAVLDSGGTAMEMPDHELVAASQLIEEEEGLKVLPASAGTVAAIGRLDSKNHVFVAILSGRLSSR